MEVAMIRRYGFGSTLGMWQPLAVPFIAIQPIPFRRKADTALPNQPEASNKSKFIAVTARMVLLERRFLMIARKSHQFSKTLMLVSAR